MLCTFRNHHVPSNVFGLQIYTGYDFTYSFCLDKIPNIDLKKKIFTMKIFDNLLIPFWHSHQWQYFLFMVKVYYFLSICLGLLQNYQLLSRYIWCFADILRELIIKYKVWVCSFFPVSLLILQLLWLHMLTPLWFELLCLWCLSKWNVYFIQKIIKRKNEF